MSPEQSFCTPAAAPDAVISPASSTAPASGTDSSQQGQPPQGDPGSDDGAAPEDLDDAKLRLVAHLARLRRERPETFVGPRSGYRAVPVTTSHAFAFARTLDEEPDVVVVVTRLARRLAVLGGWRDHVVVLPAGTWTSTLTDAVVEGGSRPLAEVMGQAEVAVLTRPRAVQPHV